MAVAKLKDGYTPQFWHRAIELAMADPKKCESCHRPEGWRDRGAKKSAPLAVRVAIRHGKDLFPGNLGLFCSRCRRGQYQIKTTRSELEKLIMPLFSNKEWSY
jgi:hypothetical protein